MSDVRQWGGVNGLEDMRAAVVLAEELHFGRAAARLHVTQSSLSRQVRRLEARLGVHLFERTTRRVRVTDVGAVYVAGARDAVRRAGAAERDARAAARGEVGRLRLAYPGSAINRLVPSVLRRFRAERPGVRLDLVELFDDDALTRAVLDGSVDAAFVRLPGRSAALTVHDLGPEPLSAVLPSGHALSRAPVPLPLAALADEDLLLWPRSISPASFDEIAGAFTAAGLALRVAQEVPTAQTLLALVAADWGVGILASSYDVLNREGVSFRPLDGLESRTHLVHRRDSTGSPVLERFVQMVAGT
jgi:DNA-binding transcriptional LysR family regulator